MKKKETSIFIRKAPITFAARTSEILGRHAINGKQFSRNDIYLEIFERGLDTYNTKKK